ncbi:MAG: hypothetical protein EBU23_16790, partial [Mycobacteriaceae bacterium]|nr:hypothetical protein [Mycobacteriaceae bacterium]
MTARMPMADRLHSSVARFGAAIAIALAVVAARWLLTPVLETRLSYAAVLVSVVPSLWLYGLGPAIVAGVL